MSLSIEAQLGYSNTMQIGHHYFARVTRGLEPFMWDDIKGSINAEFNEQLHRTVIFSTTEQPERLLTLKSPEDLFMLVGDIEGVDHTRASLSTIAHEANSLELRQAIEICRRVRTISRSFAYTITASFVGRRNYNRWEIAEALRSGLKIDSSCRYLDTKDSEFKPHDIHLRVLLEGTRAIVGVRLALQPLGDRRYKRCHIRGSLNPAVAYAMVKLAAPPHGGVLCDPMCGVGTVPIEACLSSSDLLSLGSDISEQALQGFQANIPPGVPVEVLQSNALRLPLRPGSLDSIVCDLPWGVQTKMQGNAVGSDYSALLLHWSELVKKEGLLVLLTEQKEALRCAAERAGLILQATIPISLYGRHPEIFVLRKIGPP